MPPPYARVRLAFVIAKYFEYGGLQRDLRRIALASAARGHEVHVYTGEWQGPRETQLAVHELDLRARTNHGRNQKLSRAVLAMKESCRFDCLVGFDRCAGLDVHFAGNSCLLARLKEHKPWYAWYHPRYRVYLRHERAVFAPGCDTDILLICEGEKRRFVHYYGTEEARLHLLPPGIDRPRLAAQTLTDRERLALRRELTVPDRGVMILAVGSAFRTKGVDRSIRSVARLSDEVRNRCRYVVVGRGHEARFRKLAARLRIGNQVVFAGARADVARFYHSADLLLHPARIENTGTVLLEAMLCGLPVLTTANCGWAHHVEDGEAGVVCPEPFEQERLDRALPEMMPSDKKEQWRSNALRYCESRDLYSMVDRAVEIIEARAARNRLER